MIDNIEKRREVWNNPRARAPWDDKHDLTASLPYPFEDAGIQTIFNGKDVLEMGPGRGRQYERLRDRCKTYCVADLSPDGLNEEVFASADDKFVLNDWSEKLTRDFDVVHFWYVLHHVPLKEMRDFFGFVNRNLRQGGYVAFNCPTLENVTGPMEGDGFSTTYSDPTIVWEMASPLKMLLALPIMKQSTGYVFLLQKTLNQESQTVPLHIKQLTEKNKYKWKPNVESIKPMDQITPTGESFTLIHYVFQTNPERVACMPNMTEFGKTKYHEVVLRSNAPAAVTCPACKKTDQYKNSKVRYG